MLLMGGSAWIGPGDICETSMSSTQLCYKPKTTLKYSLLKMFSRTVKKKKKAISEMPKKFIKRSFLKGINSMALHFLIKSQRQS